MQRDSLLPKTGEETPVRKTLTKVGPSIPENVAVLTCPSLVQQTTDFRTAPIPALLGANDHDVPRWFILVVAVLLDPAAVLLLLAASKRS